MGHHTPNGGRDASTDENRPSWRPQDQTVSSLSRQRGNEDDHDYGSWRERNQDRPINERDPSRWEGSRGSELGTSDDGWRATERYGQGQSGYSAGRYGDDRSQHMQNRNDMMRGSGSREDRDFGGLDRGYNPERYGAQGGYGGGRGFEPERGSQWSAYDRPQRPSMERNDMRWQRPGDRPWGNQMGGYDQHMGYQGGNRSERERMDYRSGYGGSQDDPQRVDSFGAHQHRGTGPHRGKGPAGYQRSDERIRELVSEALADDDQIDASQIHVTVKDGEVTLTGIVDDRRTRREAEDCVASVSGVRDVQVQLRVKDDRQGHAQATGTTQTGAGKHEAETAQDKKPRA